MLNRTLKRILIGWIILIVIVAIFGDISIGATNNGRTAADFLQIGLGARAAGFGGAYTAISEGPAASYWNPAGLSNLTNKEVLFSHFAWYQDVTLEHGSFAFPLRDDVAMAVSFTYLNYGTIDGYDINGIPTGELSAHDMAGGLSVGWDVRDELSVGITGKYINQQLHTYRASCFAVDLGAKYRLDHVTVAATVGNIGQKLTFLAEAEKLPAVARLGLSFKPANSNIIAAVELQKEFYGGLTLRQGVELGFSDQYFVRAGYDSRAGADGQSFVSGLSMGAGISWDLATVDYAFTPRNNTTSEDLHRFSIVFKLGP